MSVIAKITPDIKDYEKALAKVQRDTIAAGRNMGKGFGSAGNAVNDLGQKVGKTGALVSGLGSELGGSFGALGRVISAVASGPVMALTAAIGGLVALGVEIWDKMTLSAEEYAAKLDRAAQAADKHREAVEKQTAEDQTYMDRLAELASKEQLSNEAKAEAATLIRNLSARYGDLGLSIDKVTGKISGMDKAQAEFLKKVRKQRMQAVSEQIGSTERRAANEAQRATTGMFIGEESLNRIGLGWRSADEAKSAIAGVMESGNTKKQIEMAERLRDASKTTADAEAWQKVIDSLEKVRNLQREYNLLSETGRASEKEAAEAMKKRTDADQREVEAKAAAAKRQADIVSDLELQLKYQQMINGGLTEEAAKLKIVNDLKRQGITDPATIDRITGIRAQIGGEKLRSAQGEQSLSLYDRALRASGRGEQADIISAVQAAEKAKGGKLTGEEYDRVLDMTELAKSLERAASGQNFGDLAIRTNSLTARGGFATGAVAPDTDKYARAQVEQGKQLVSIVGRIEKLCEDFGTF